MTIRSVTVTQLRNHARTDLACASQVTILTGSNGAGKTSLLEAVHMCAVGKSFVPVSDSALIGRGAELAHARVRAVRDTETPYDVAVTLREGARKRIESSLGTSLTPRDIIGELPVVALSPDHKAITFGAPADRRSFLDAVMAQGSRSYTDLLYEHRRILKQRNALLQEAYGRGVPPGLDVWTQAFVKVAADIVMRRAEFIAMIAPVVCDAYAAIAGNGERVEMLYQPDTPAARMEAVAQEMLQRELQRGTTMFGPQKDEVQLTINGGLVKETASQGQHKSLLVALKLAECKVLQAARNERPVVLLDDVFSELDASRCEHVMTMILAMGMQCIVTTTEGNTIATMIPPGTDVAVITLADGHIELKDAA